MKRKKICLTFGHFMPSNGVCRAAIAIANILTEYGYDVTLVPLFRVDKQLINSMNPKVHIQKVFGFYFHGLARIVDLIPDTILYWWIFSKKGFDLEIGFQYELPIKIIAAGSVKKGKKRLAWIHTYDEGLHLRKQYERIGKVVSVSKQNSDRLAQELPSVISEYSYNPIDEKIVVEQSKEPIKMQHPDCPLFVSVGRHSPEKGYIRLINIIAKLRDEGYKMQLWLIGDGPQHEELVEHCNRLKLNDIVLFTGSTQNPHKYTVKGDVFVCSSYREGYSTACTEAIMLGIPVITTDVGGSREIIDDSGCGIHCGLDDESLYQAIKSVLDNPNVIADWKAIVKNTKISFSQEERAKRLIRIVEETI